MIDQDLGVIVLHMCKPKRQFLFPKLVMLKESLFHLLFLWGLCAVGGGVSSRITKRLTL